MLRLGVIGMSKGNGHPYSWSAIINGDYDAKVMADCGFPVIPAYLAANRDILGVDDTSVTHVWTQDRKISEQIAAASKIDTIVERLEDLIGNVDAVLLARDDPENHVEMAKPFLEAGVPIFIDKPIAATDEDLDYFEKQNAAGKFLMSCSSMRYSTETAAVRAEMDSLGKIELVTAVGKKDGIKYGVHMLEGLFALLGDPRAAQVKHVSESHRDIVVVEFEDGPIATLHLFYDIAPTFQFSVFGRTGWRLIEQKNSYASFRDCLVEFIRSVREGRPRLSFDKTKNIIRTLIGAQKSLEQGGKTITL